MITYMDLIRMELEGLYGTEVQRDMNDIIELYNIYEGDYKKNTPADLDYTPTDSRTNFIKKLIKEEARFLFGKTPEFTVKSGKANKENAQAIQQMLSNVLESNQFSDKLIKAARDCFIGKRVAIKVWYNEAKKKLLFSFRPSLEFIYETAEDDTDTLSKIIFLYGKNDKQDKNEQRIWKQKYEMVGGKCYKTEGVYDGFGRPVEIVSENEDTGLDFIPAYVILNDGLSGDLKGESDVDELKTLQAVYNNLTSDDIDALKFNMFPQTIAINASEDSLKNIVISPAALIDLQTETTSPEGSQANMTKLESSFNYDSRLENSLHRVKNDMHELLSVPLVTPSELQGFATSGKALKALYWQLIIRCEEKFTTWRPALLWLAETLLKMLRFYSIEKVNLYDDMKIVVENIYPLMEDEYEEKQQDLSEVNTQVRSRKSYMKKWGKDVDDELADEELRQIQLEKQMLEDSYNGDFNTGGGLNVDN